MVSILYEYSPAKWRLGTPCKRGHFWPGTELSLRSTYVSPAGASTPYCAGCRGGKDWLLRFIDCQASGVPVKYRLGSLCPQGHAWEGTSYSLRRKGSGHCRQCEIEHGSSYDPERAHYWYERNKESRRAAARESYQRRKQDGEHQEWLERTREQRKEYKRRARRKAGATEREAIALSAALKKSPAPTVAELVQEQQRVHWKESPGDYREHVRKRARQSHQWRQMTDAQYRRYHRDKSKRRKAEMRKLHAVRFRKGEIDCRFQQFNNTCAYCGATGDLHIEHFIPIAKGGPHAIGNIVPACQSCNFSKRDHDPEDWYRGQAFFSSARWALILQVLGKTRTPVNQLPLL